MDYNPPMTESQLRHLGKQTPAVAQKYSPGLLDAFENPHPQSGGWVSLVCPEFTSLCPKTGQPDFARIHINYIPDQKMVESKSLKLYFFSFRNHGAFHEDCIATICRDLAQLMIPKFIEVIGEFTPRGGIAIWPYISECCDEKKYRELKEYRERHYRLAPNEKGASCQAPPSGFLP